MKIMTLFFKKLKYIETHPPIQEEQKAGPCEGGGSGNNLGDIIYSFHLNISPKVTSPKGVLECDIITE